MKYEAILRKILWLDTRSVASVTGVDDNLAAFLHMQKPNDYMFVSSDKVGKEYNMNYNGPNRPVFTKIIGHVGHFRWLGPNVRWEISRILIEYIKPIGQMSDESWKFFGYTEKGQQLKHRKCAAMLLKTLPLVNTINYVDWCNNFAACLYMQWPNDCIRSVGELIY